MLYDNKRKIVKGDTTTHGGRVVFTSSSWGGCHGEYARVGDLVECPRCGGVYRIESGPKDQYGNDLPYAIEGQRTECGATLVSRFGLGLFENEDGALYCASADFRAQDICEMINRYGSQVTPFGPGGRSSRSGGSAGMTTATYVPINNEIVQKDEEENVKTKTKFYVDLKNEDTRFNEFLSFTISVHPGLYQVPLDGERALVGEFEPGTYAVTIEPTPPPGEVLGPVMWSDNRKFRRDITLSGEEEHLRIEITRKEAVEHNIMMTFRVDEPPVSKEYTTAHRLHAHSTHALSKPIVLKYAKQYGLDPETVFACIYIEETQGWNDAVFRLVPESIQEKFPKARNKSIRPMNVNIEYWSRLFKVKGVTRQDLYDYDINIREGCWLMHRCMVRANPNTPKVTATLYNNSKAMYHMDYGWYFERLYIEKPWHFPRQEPVSFD